MQEGLLGLAHIGIYTKDIDTSVSFYEKLGFELIGTGNPGAKLAFVSLGTCIIELIQPADLKRLEGLTGGIIPHFAIECQNIEAVVEKYKTMGIIPQEASVSTSDKVMDGIKNIFFVGPSGERIELLDYYNRR